jgi:hypothetical protein
MANDLELPAPPRVSSQDKLLQLVQAKYPGYHPIVAMAEIAHSTEDEIVELHCHKEIAKYVVAVDRFVEVKQEVKQTKRVVVELFGGPDQPRATPIENNASPVLEVTDAIDKNAVRDVARRSTVDVYERKMTVTEHGSSEDAPRDPLAGVWGDGTSPGAERFS